MDYFLRFLPILIVVVCDLLLSLNHVGLAIIALVFLISLLIMVMAKTKVPSKSSKKDTYSPPNPPPSNPLVKRQRHDDSSSGTALASRETSLTGLAFQVLL